MATILVSLRAGAGGIVIGALGHADPSGLLLGLAAAVVSRWSCGCCASQRYGESHNALQSQTASRPRLLAGVEVSGHGGVRLAVNQKPSFWINWFRATRCRWTSCSRGAGSAAPTLSGFKAKAIMILSRLTVLRHAGRSETRSACPGCAVRCAQVAHSPAIGISGEAGCGCFMAGNGDASGDPSTRLPGVWLATPGGGDRHCRR